MSGDEKPPDDGVDASEQPTRAEIAAAKRKRRSVDAPPLASTAPRESPPPQQPRTSPLPGEKIAERLRERIEAAQARKRVPKARVDDGEPDHWDRAFEWIGRYGAPWATLALAVGILILFSGVFRGETLGDDLTFHMAEAARLSDCIRQGDWDFWNPSANSGYASAYYYQVIPQLASALPAALFGNFLFWFQLSLVTPLVVMPISTYRGARMMGATPWQSFAAAICVAFISGASRWGGGADGTFYVGLYTQTWALSFFPLALGHSIRWMRDGTSLAPSVVWGALVFLCHPFSGISLYVAIGLGVVVHVLMPLGRLYVAQLSFLAIATMGFALNFIYLLTERKLTETQPQEEVMRWLYLVPMILIGALIGRLIWNIVRNPDGPQEPIEWNKMWPPIVRLFVLALCLLLATLPGWITVLVDREGFGGFPHRVADEVGPGYKELMDWQLKGWILDNQRPMVLSWLIPLVIVFPRRTKLLHWLWTPAFVFAVFLAIGPHVPKTSEDLLPAVRFLGAMQTVLAMAIGIGVFAVATWLWNLEEGSLAARIARWFFVGLIAVGGLLFLVFLWLGADTGVGLRIGYRLLLYRVEDPDTVRLILTLMVLPAATYGAYAAAGGLLSIFGIRTGIAAVIAILLVLLVLPGSSAITTRVHVLEEYGYRDELLAVSAALERQPQGRKQVGPGCENHWWNLLTYVYGRRPSLLQMGGGGLQASPNYDFVWSVRDFHKLAWVFDTPYFVFEKSNANQPEGQTIFQTERYEIRRLRTNGIVAPAQVTGVLDKADLEKKRDDQVEELEKQLESASDKDKEALEKRIEELKKEKPVRKAAIEWLRSDIAYKDHVLAYDGHGGPGSPPDATVLRAFRQDSPGDQADILAELDVRQPSTFVIRESWHPRWKAYVDGEEVPVRRVTPDFPAVDVPAGKHVLALRFERPWWAHASWLAWPGVALLAFLGLRLFDKLMRERAAA